MAGQNVVHFNDGSFDKDVLQADKPTLVDFTATWCAPCRALAPVIDSIADQFSGSVKVGKLDIDENPSTAEKYRIRGVPTVILFKGGQVVDQVVGLVAKTKLETMIQKALGQ